MVHELGHGLAACRWGDPTALEEGRITLRPSAHLEPIGAFLVPAVSALLTLVAGVGMVFGWGRPVPVNPDRLREPRRDSVKVALAGPVSSLVLLYLSSLALAGVAALFLAVGPAGRLDLASVPLAWLEKPAVEGAAGGWYVAFTVLRWSLLINSFLVAGNLLPFLPLDGGWLVRLSLPRPWRNRLELLQTLSLPALALLLATGWAAVLLWPVALLWYVSMAPAAWLNGLPLPELLG
ncbi:MAG: site-2 protease family protein [Armatimonadetes bacterium]|nr:site-2 protease family protein [Armatimonadota bacterium]